MKLKYKIPLIMLVAFALLVGSFVASVLSNSSAVRRESQFETARSSAQDYSNSVKAYISEKLIELKGLENNISVLADLSDEVKMDNLLKLLKELADKPVISAVYATFERGSFLHESKTEPNHYITIDAFRPVNGGDIEFNVDESYFMEDNEDNEWYFGSKKSGKANLTEPYKWTYEGETVERSMISLTFPIYVNGKYIGSFGMDFELEPLQKELFAGMRDSVMKSYVILVSNEGLIVAYPDKKMLFTEIGHNMEADKKQDLKDAIKEGKYHRVLKVDDVIGEAAVVSYMPMHINDLKPWSVAYIVSHATLRDEELRVRKMVMSVMVTAFSLWALILFLLMSNVFKHLTDMTKLLRKMTDGDGDLTIRLQASGKDEIGQMSKSLNKFVEKLHSTIKTTQRETKTLLDSSSVLYRLSSNLSHSAETSLSQSENVSKITETASANADSIAKDAERTSDKVEELSDTATRMSDNMNSVASAVEELSASFKEITGNTDSSRDIASDATKKSIEATSVMNKLGEAAKEIGHVTDVIKRIADKTNLLALNATIEAASAGDAGKGFTVVAGEIKGLANQSAQSADDIAQRIASIQNGTNNAVKVINTVSGIISKINVSIDEIASSVSQQTIASSEIARNASQANFGAKQLVKSIDEIALTAKASAQGAEYVANSTKSVSDSVSVMYEGAKKSNSDSAELTQTADKLKHMAEHLESIVHKFKT